mmetsp:Transcript_36603/g.66363  ORF Transcript_36603/g.66363 Transcript_36603/m.66363 type:complete len:205 (+) Transcript_36603:409-1023(+)
MRSNAVTSSLHCCNDLFRGLAFDVHVLLALQGLQGIVPLLLAEVDGADFESHGLRILASHVAKASASSQDSNPLPCFRLSLLQGLVGGHASAEDGSCLRIADRIGDPSHIPGLGHGVLCKAAICSEAGLVLISANCLPAREAVIAATAGVMEPGMANAVSDLQRGHTLAQLDDDASSLVSGDDWQLGLHMPVTITNVEISVANT